MRKDIKVRITEEVHLGKVEYFFGDNDITYIVFKEGSHIEISDSEKEYEMLMVRKKILPIKAIVFVEPFVTFSSESRKFWLKGKGKGLIQREAILSNALAPKILLLATKKLIPKFELEIKFFKTLEKAEKWVLRP